MSKVLDGAENAGQRSKGGRREGGRIRSQSDCS